MGTLIINTLLTIFKVKTIYTDKHGNTLRYGNYVYYNGGQTKSRAKMKVTAKLWNHKIETCLDACGENWCYELENTPNSIIELIGAE